MAQFARRTGPALVIAALLALLAFQAWAYASRLTLSLGPRVILEPWLVGRGELLYDRVSDPHTPLMPLSIAALAPLVPDGLARARLVLVSLLTLTTLLAFLAARRNMGWAAGLWAAGFVVLWSPRFGFAKLWHESFLAPLYLALLLCFGACANRRSPLPLLLAGFVGGIALLVKQHAALVLAGFAIYTVAIRWRMFRSPRLALRDLGLMVLAAIVPFAAILAYQYARAGSLASFFYWTVGYTLTSEYKSLAALAPTPSQLMAIAPSGLLVPGAILGWIESRHAGDARWQSAGLVVVLLACSSATAYPRYSPIHLQASLPLLAWLSAWVLDAAARSGGAARRFARGVGLALPLFWLVAAGRAYLPAHKEPSKPRVLEYSDLVPLARDIRQHIGPDECVYLFPDDEATANLYYLLDCPTPSFWVFHYPWYMDGWIRERILSTLKEEPPVWVVYYPGRWQVEERAPEIIDYLEGHYTPAATLQWSEGEVLLLKPRQ